MFFFLRTGKMFNSRPIQPFSTPFVVFSLRFFTPSCWPQTRNSGQPLVFRTAQKRPSECFERSWFPSDPQLPCFYCKMRTWFPAKMRSLSAIFEARLEFPIFVRRFCWELGWWDWPFAIVRWKHVTKVDAPVDSLESLKVYLYLGCPRKLGSMVSNWVITYL